MEQIKRMNMSFVTSQNMFVWLGTVGQLLWIWLLDNYMNLIVVILAFGFLAIIIILYKQVSTVTTSDAFFCNIELRLCWGRSSLN